MDNETQEPTYRRKSNAGSLLAGLFFGGLAGVVAALLLAPQSGEATRRQIREKSIELRDRTTGLVEDTMAKGREKFHKLKHQGQELAVGQLDVPPAGAGIAAPDQLHALVDHH